MFLFKDRNLNIAIFISFLSHLVCMLSVTPVIASRNTKPSYGTISFLGSILENLGKSYFMQRTEDTGHSVSHEVSLKAPLALLKFTGVEPDKKEFVSSENKTVLPLFKLHYEKKDKRKIHISEAWITGNLKDRTLLHKPPLPKTAFLNYDFDINHEAVVGFRISKHGFVENPECVISSGSLDIDQRAVRYVRGWQFMPDDGEADRAKEGSVRIRFTAY